MKQYLDLLQKILTEGIKAEDRTGTGTLSLFGHQMRFNLREGFPLVTTKNIHWKSVVHELLWFLSGNTNIKYLQDNGVKIWDEWADKEGNLGSIYGKQWRAWEGKVKDSGQDGITGESYVEREVIDQISQVLEILKTNPTSRRMVVSAWNVADLPDMALAPCHCLFQFHTSPLTVEQRKDWYVSGYERKKGKTPTFVGSDTWLKHTLDMMKVPQYKLSCQLYQRSADVFLGVPFNIASYSLLTLMVAQCVNMVPGEFIWTGGDTHLYNSHIKQAHIQLEREPFSLPKVLLNKEIVDLFSFKYEDIELVDYFSHPSIKAPVAI